jgi:hypothetical protein
MATLVGIVSVVVNVGVSFMTDGTWKTAGSGLAQFYWNHTNRREEDQVERRRARGRRPAGFDWNAAPSGVPVCQ